MDDFDKINGLASDAPRQTRTIRLPPQKHLRKARQRVERLKANDWTQAVLTDGRLPRSSRREFRDSLLLVLADYERILRQLERGK